MLRQHRPLPTDQCPAPCGCRQLLLPVATCHQVTPRSKHAAIMPILKLTKPDRERKGLVRLEREADPLENSHNQTADPTAATHARRVPSEHQEEMLGPRTWTWETLFCRARCSGGWRLADRPGPQHKLWVPRPPISTTTRLLLTLPPSQCPPVRLVLPGKQNWSCEVPTLPVTGPPLGPCPSQPLTVDTPPASCPLSPDLLGLGPAHQLGPICPPPACLVMSPGRVLHSQHSLCPDHRVRLVHASLCYPINTSDSNVSQPLADPPPNTPLLSQSLVPHPYAASLESAVYTRGLQVPTPLRPSPNWADGAESPEPPDRVTMTPPVCSQARQRPSSRTPPPPPPRSHNIPTSRPDQSSRRWLAAFWAHRSKPSSPPAISHCAAPPGPLRSAPRANWVTLLSAPSALTQNVPPAPPGPLPRTPPRAPAPAVPSVRLLPW